MRKSVLLITLIVLTACKEGAAEANITIKELNSSEKFTSEEKIKNPKRDSVRSNDIQFINDSVLNGKFKLDISKYELENAKKNCHSTTIEKEEFYEYSIAGDRNPTKDFKNLGDLNGDGKNDSVFILPGLSLCEEGQSYYFTNNKIPRIQTDSYCCHTQSIFSIGDIDEDGGNEVAEYYSSCASNFKVIDIWTLKENQWKLVDKFTFYYNNGKYEAFKDFNKLYKKISTNKFKFLEISDMRANGEVIMEWKTVIMK